MYGWSGWGAKRARTSGRGLGWTTGFLVFTGTGTGRGACVATAASAVVVVGGAGAGAGGAIGATATRSLARGGATVVAFGYHPTIASFRCRGASALVATASRNAAAMRATA